MLFLFFRFFFNGTATTEIYTLSLHDALPILIAELLVSWRYGGLRTAIRGIVVFGLIASDRKSTRLNSSHTVISYAVFCLKKKRIHTKSLLNALFRLFAMYVISYKVALSKMSL